MPERLSATAKQNRVVRSSGTTATRKKAVRKATSTVRTKARVTRRSGRR